MHSIKVVLNVFMVFLNLTNHAPVFPYLFKCETWNFEISVKIKFTYRDIYNQRETNSKLLYGEFFTGSNKKLFRKK